MHPPTTPCPSNLTNQTVVAAVDVKEEKIALDRFARFPKPASPIATEIEYLHRGTVGLT